MPKKEIVDAIQKLDYTNVPFSEVSARLYYDDVGGIIQKYGDEHEGVIIAALPDRVRFLYHVLWLQTTCMTDGLLSLFYNNSVFEIKRFLKIVKSAGLTDLTDLVEKALRVILTKFPMPSDESLTFMEDSDAQPRDFFGDDIGNAIDVIENEIDDGLMSSDEFWDRVELAWNSL